jgi:hypothetical protein
MLGEMSFLVVPETGTPEQNLEAAQGLAWDHARLLASEHRLDLPVGSDEFVDLYNRVMARYTQCLDSYGFLQNLALRVMSELFSTGRVMLLAQLDADEEEVSSTLAQLSAVVLGAFMWLYASSDGAWVDNEAWDLLSPESRGVDFTFGTEALGGDSNV